MAEMGPMERPHHPAAVRDKVGNRVELPDTGSQGPGEVWDMEQAHMVVTRSNDHHGPSVESGSLLGEDETSVGYIDSKTQTCQKL